MLFQAQGFHPLAALEAGDMSAERHKSSFGKAERDSGGGEELLNKSIGRSSRTIRTNR